MSLSEGCGLSAADVAAVTGNNGMFGGENGAWWIIILFLFAFAGGWNNGGWNNGYGGGQSTSVYEGYVLNNDFSQLSKQISDTYNMTDRKFEGLANGMCSLGYENLGQINGVNMNIKDAQAGITNAITTNGYENRLGQQTIGQQISNCCCDLKQQLGDVKYTISDKSNMIERGVSDGFCQTNFNNERNTRSIVDAQTASTQAILARLDAMENSRKDEKIAEQACIINNQYLLSQINRTPIPAYQVPNPYCNCGNSCC